MSSYDLTRKLTRGIYTALTAGALGLTSLVGCDKYPIDPPPTEPNNHPLSSLSVFPISGISPLEIRVQGSCTDIDGDLKDYKVMSGGSIITRTNPIDTLVTLTQDASFNSYCEDARGNISSSGPVNVSVTQPPQILDQIAFWSNRGYNEDVYSGDIVIVDGAPKLLNERRLTTNPGQDLEPTYSPDGNEILFTSNRTNRTAVWRMNVDGSNQRDITSSIVEHARNANWCSNGKIVVAYRNKGDSEAGIGIINPNENNFTPIYSEPISGKIPGWPKWNQDCSKIAFQKAITGNWEIYTMNSNGSNLSNVTNNFSKDQQPAWSPADSKIVFISDRDGNLSLYELNLNNNDTKILTNNEGTEVDPFYSSDGNKIIFSGVSTNNFHLYLMNKDGTNIVRLTTNGDNRYPSWRPRPR